MDTLLPGITAERVPTSRLTVNALSVAGRTTEPSGHPRYTGCPLVVPAAYRGRKLRAVRRGDLGGVQT